MEKYNCMCKDWSKSMDQIIAQNVYCVNRSNAPKYTAPFFRFCPWCGSNLKKGDVKKLCHKCTGSGIVEKPALANAWPFTEYRECSLCNGVGEIPSTKSQISGD